MREIKLTNGKVALVDAQDYERLNQWKWYARREGSTYYAFRNARVDEPGNTIRMHRVITNAAKGMVVDHRDGNGLNNSRKNLRNTTQAMNLRNMKRHRQNPSSLGVTRRKCGKYQAQIKQGKRVKYLGLFETPLEAHKAFMAANPHPAPRRGR